MHTPEDRHSPAAAQRVGAAMYARDTVAQKLSMTLAEIEEGYAKLSMRVTAEMLNGHGICHGGYVFTLADTAFAYACNSYNQIALAANCAIDFVAPAREGDLLTASAREQFLAGRSGIYDVEVTNQRGDRVALMRGRSQRIKGEIISDTPL